MKQTTGRVSAGSEKERRKITSTSRPYRDCVLQINYTVHSLLDNRNITLRNPCILVRLNDFLKYNIVILINKIFKNELRSLSTFFFLQKSIQRYALCSKCKGIHNRLILFSFAVANLLLFLGGFFYMDSTVNDYYVIKRHKLWLYDDIGAMNYVTCVYIMILIHTMNHLMRILAFYC